MYTSDTDNDLEPISNTSIYTIVTPIFALLSLLNSYINFCAQSDLSKSGVLDTQIDKLEYINYTFFISILFLPLCDTYFLNKIGLRKTYVTLILITLTVLIFIASITLVKFYKILDLAGVMVQLIIIQIIANILQVLIDAYIVETVSTESQSVAAAIKLGVTSLVSYLIIKIYLTSEGVHVEIYFRALTLCFLVCFLYVTNNMKEQPSYISKCALRPLKKRVKSFTNHIFELKFQPFFLFLCFNAFGTGLYEQWIVQQQADVIIQSYSQITLFLILLQIGLLCLGLILISKLPISQLFLFMQLIRIINNIYCFMVYNYYKDNQQLFLIYYLIQQGIHIYQLLIITTLIYKNSTKKFCGMMVGYLLFINKLGNGLNSFSTDWLIELIGVTGCGILGIIIQFIVLYYIKQNEQQIFQEVEEN